MPEKHRHDATQTVRLVCWNDELAEQRSAEIARLGYRVDASSLRGSKTTRHLPIVFAGGVEEKVARLRSELPDAVFTLWEKITPALKRAMASPPIEPVRPVPHMERWNRSSLTQKLGIAANMK